MDSGLRKLSLDQDERNKGNPAHPRKSIVSEEEIKEEMKAFRALFPVIINDVTEGLGELEEARKWIVDDKLFFVRSEGLGELEEARKWIVDCFSYNVAHGYPTYSLGTVLYYKLIVGKTNCSSEKLFLARILSWCVQMFNAFLFMADDIMDRSVTRRKNLCWYRKEGVGMTAVNDICFIQNSIFQIVNKYFSRCDCYTDVLDTFMELSRECIIGQYLDMQTNLQMKKTDLRNFTFEKYTQIVNAKAAPFLVLTMALGLCLAGYKKEIVKHPKVDGILRKIQFFVQEQNDYLDCFGEIAEFGKIGNDIENGKCTWLIVTALQKASESQLKILEENYGVDAPYSKEKVVKVYKDLKLDEMYLEHEERKYKEIIEEAQQLSDDEKLCFFQPLIIIIVNHIRERKYQFE